MSAYPTLNGRNRVAYVGTYPPKECGIATFTMDVINATDIAGWKSVVIAVDDARPTSAHPDSKVIDTIVKEDRGEYKRVARLLSEYKVDLLSIQHEYGIYGGDHGEYVIDLARASRVPVVVTLHTVLPQPTEWQKFIIQELNKHCEGFVVMAHKAIELLRDAYGIPAHKVHMIPHGAPNTPFHPEKSAKARFGLQGRRVISTFGLISPNKGIEDAIAAMPQVVANDPTAKYLILGQTHPVVKRREGEWYRESLVKQVSDLGIEDNVEFVDKYLSLQELLDYLLATDVYVTPYYANPHQITSGTLAYAVAAGKVVVSTPYTYAQELLAEGRGFLYPFRDTKALADVVSRVLTDRTLFETTRANAYAYGRGMTWQSVGIQYTKLFTHSLNEPWINHRAAVDTLALPGIGEIPGIVWAPAPIVASAEAHPAPARGLQVA